MALTLAAVALALADLLVTLIAIKKAGADVEANLIHNAIISRYGLVGFSFAYIIGAGLLIYIFSRDNQFLVGMVAVLGLLFLNNIIALIRLHQ